MFEFTDSQGRLRVYPDPLDSVDRLLIQASADREREEKHERLVNEFLAAHAPKTPAQPSPCVDPDDVRFVPEVDQEDEKRSVDTDNARLASAVRRYERLREAFDAGEMTGEAMEDACDRVWFDTGFRYEEAMENAATQRDSWQAQEKHQLMWLHRDDVERWQEAQRVAQRTDAAERWLSEFDPERAEAKPFDRTLAVTGMLAGSLEALDREWLNARLSEIKADCQGGRLGKPLAGLERKKQIRRGVSLQFRFTLRRIVEAVAEKRGTEFREEWASCERWRRGNGLTYKQAVEMMTVRLGGGRELHPRITHVRVRNTWRDVERGSAASRSTVCE